MKNKGVKGAGISGRRWAVRLALWLGVFLGLGIFASSASAQTMFSDLTGVVSDPSGAGVPKATVTLINAETNSRRTATTDDTGAYRINGLLVGSYSLEVEAQGFKKYLQTGITLQPAILKRVDVSLELGAVTQTVEVRDAVPVIVTETPALTTGIPKIANAEKPLMNETRAGYTYDALTWTPGAASGRGIYSFAGNLPSMQQTNLEGVQHDQYVIRVPSSAIAEVNVVMSNAPAEYARPVTMDATFRSGNNRLTGEFWANFVNPCTNARNTPFSQPTSWSCKTEWRFFYTAGGPLYIPKVYDGRNKTFFFFTMNKSPIATVTGIPVVQSVPTQAMQAGDFSRYPKTIIDPATGEPFAGNVIPSARISQFAQGVISDFYGDKYSYVGGPDNFTNNGSQTGGYTGGDKHKILIKLDHNLGSRDIFSGSYQVLKGEAAQDRNISAPADSGETRVKSGVGQIYNAHFWSLAQTHTFSPTVVNQLRLGVTRTVGSLFTVGPDWDISNPISGADVVQRWGLQGITPPLLSGYPQFFITNWNFSTADNESFNVDTRYSAYNNLSIYKGAHSIKLGYSAIKLLEDGTATGPYFGNFAFNGLFTGEPWADFLLGLPSSFERYVTRPTVARRRWEHGLFIQDDYRISNNFTFYYGVRWDKFTVPYDKNGMYYNYDPQTHSVVVPDARALSQVNPAWPTEVFPIRLASEVGFPSKLIKGTSSFQPRLGFSYKFGPRFVLRGGYGVYTGALRFAELQTGGPFAITENFINTPVAGSPTGARYAMPNPFPESSATAEVASITGFSLNYRTPYSQNWNLTLEHEVLKNWGVRATYRGVKSTQLLWVRDLNEVQASALPFSESRRPFPGLQNINFIENGANDNYHALALELTHPWVNGFYMTGAYTYARSGTTSPGGPFDRDQTASPVEYSYDRDRDYGRHVAYPTHDFIMNFVGDLPVGNGKRLATSANRVINALIGNWTFVGSFSWRSGWFFTPVLQGVDPGNLGKTGDRRPDLVPGCDPYAGGRDVHGLWFNPACFVEPAAGQLGNVQVNSLVGPGAWVFNLNPYKDFPLNFIREGTKLRFGANIYNLLNHPTYANPVNNLNSAVAGQITRTEYARGWSHDYSDQRQFVFDMRIIF